MALCVREEDQVTPCQILINADDDVGQWVAEKTGFDWLPGSGTAMGFVHGERLIAGAVFFRYNGASCEIGFASIDPRWMSRANLKSVFSYCFEQLNLKRLTSITDASNAASRKLNEALGFEIEATFERAAPDGDQIVYRLFRENCKWTH